MDDFQKHLRQLRGSRAFAAAFDKKRAEAEVAFQIRRLRESKGWSQKDLAKKVGCSQQAVSAVEQAGYATAAALRRIAHVLDAEVVVALFKLHNSTLQFPGRNNRRPIEFTGSDPRHHVWRQFQGRRT
jgi:transcriptional regulator with XRE-family HTH domain